MDDAPVDFHVIDISRNAQRAEAVRALLAANRLGMDSDVRYFMLALDNQRLVGCAGLAKNIIKCVAVAPEWRGQNLSARLLQEVERYALAQG
jgi:[citrate (pro-3S)-lyase] ligase